MKKENECLVSIVIPAYNEEKRLVKTLRNTITFLKRQSYNSEILVVSDGSTDNTISVVKSFVKDFENIKTIEYFPNLGKGHAVKTGMLESIGKFRLFMDADYCVSIEYLSTFLMMIENDYDIVIGSRGLRQSQIDRHQPFIRELLAKIFGIIQRIVLNLPFIDTTCGFKLYKNEIVELLFPLIQYKCAFFDQELLYLAYNKGFSIGEIGVRWTHDGETRLPIGIKRTIEIVKKLIKIRIIHRKKYG